MSTRPAPIPARALRILREEGMRGVVERIAWRIRTANPLRTYARWVRAYDTMNDELRAVVREQLALMPYRPLVSVVMPTFNSPERWLRAALDSVIAQLYPNWELCIADDGSSMPHVRAVLEEYQARDRRIKVHFRDAQGHISAASNSALALASGEFVALLDHDDLLPEHALFLAVKYLNEHPEADLLYSDEDKVSPSGARFDPYFKPDWNPDLLLSHNCFSHLGLFRASLLRAIGGFRAGVEGSQDWDLVLRALAASRSGEVVHVPHVLYHWRVIEGSAASGTAAKPYTVSAAHRAIQDFVQLRGDRASVEEVNLGPATVFRVKHEVPDSAPQALIVVSARGRPESVRRCLAGLREKTSYAPADVVVVIGRGVSAAHRDEIEQAARDGQAEVLETHDARTFTAWLQASARHSVVVFMDAQIEPADPGWLAELVAHAMRPGIGAVSGKLFHQDGLVHHAGLVIGLRNGIDFAHQGCSTLSGGYAGRASLTQNVTAVTGLCLAIQRGRVLEAGGADAHLSVDLADVDLCVRLAVLGYRNLYTPYARLVMEGAALPRRPGRAAAAARKAAVSRLLASRLGDACFADPAYSPQLNQDAADFMLGWPPRLTLAQDILRPLRAPGSGTAA